MIITVFNKSMGWKNYYILEDKFGYEMANLLRLVYLTSEIEISDFMVIINGMEEIEK